MYNLPRPTNNQQITASIHFHICKFDTFPLQFFSNYYHFSKSVTAVYKLMRTLQHFLIIIDALVSQSTI